ncbi:MAG: hypothetical protein EAZ39_09170 [Oscillatoriales cyanobacterium]|nr:MAG: hypothetical protein EAZ39_09170 [Oscillatoriales cyanobacterium]
MNIRNYGLDGFPTDNSNELKWDTIEEEITHWKTAIKSDPNDADARMKLGLALMVQDATNRPRLCSKLKAMTRKQCRLLNFTVWLIGE